MGHNLNLRLKLRTQSKLFPCKAGKNPSTLSQGGCTISLTPDMDRSGTFKQETCRPGGCSGNPALLAVIYPASMCFYQTWPAALELHSAKPSEAVKASFFSLDIIAWHCLAFSRGIGHCLLEISALAPSLPLLGLFNKGMRWEQGKEAALLTHSLSSSVYKFSIKVLANINEV